MNSTKMLLTSFITGAAIGILFAPASGRVTRSKFSRVKNNFDNKLERELRKFDKAIKKQLKTARKEIKELVENQQHHVWPQDVNNSV